MKNKVLIIVFLKAKFFSLQNSPNNIPLFFYIKEIDKLLTLSTEAFLEGDGVEIDMKKREV